MDGELDMVVKEEERDRDKWERVMEQVAEYAFGRRS